MDPSSRTSSSNGSNCPISQQIPGKISVTSKGAYRLLVLNGEEGVVACRVRGECSSTFPQFSKERVMEGAMRSFLRMRNLIAVRGNAPGARMIGPCDYFGNVEKPHKYKFTINIDNEGVPLFLRHENGDQDREDAKTVEQSDITTKVTATWYKGTSANLREIQEKYNQQNNAVVGESLFPNSGILEIEADSHLILKKFDAKRADLSSFKARLVDNQIPFQITSEKLPSSDEYRAITYLFEPQYANHQVENGGGLFLEAHAFAQTITPLDKSSGGFVTLAKWTDESFTKLEMIGVEIPFGHTLIIERDCIHGDTNLAGMFMMCMTSNHKTMKTVDCVFLKSAITKKNISLSIEGNNNIQTNNEDPLAARPFAAYYTESVEDKRKFKKDIRNKDVIFNPFQSI